jgi:3-methyladenine DNA glycosylase/8-oxoguanine DNA glycosylase
VKFTLPARKPFNFLSVVHSHGWYQLAPFHFEEETDSLHSVLQLANGRVIELHLREGVDGVAVETEKLDKQERREVSDKIVWMFGLDMDFSRFYAASRGEPKLARLKARSLGRVLRSPTLFEDVIKTILTTNTLWTVTRNMTRKLVSELGAPLDRDPEARAFPSPAVIAASSPEFLKEKVRVGYRASAIHHLAVRVSSGELDLESLRTSNLPTLELRKQLMSLKGVGPYAAANLLMILGRTDFIPIDSYALKMVSHEWYKGKPVTAKEVEKRFEQWGEFKGIAFWFWDWSYKD